MINATFGTEEEITRIASEVASRHLETVKHWHSEEYSLAAIRVEGAETEPIVVLDAVYKADMQTPQRGSGQSVQLYVDVNTQKVIRELAFQ